MNDETNFDAEVPPPGRAEELSPANLFPWPPRDGESPIDAISTTWTGAMFRPSGFFRGMPEEEPVGPAVLYALIIGVVAASIRMFWSFVLPAPTIALEDITGAALFEHPMQLLLARAHQTLADFLLAPVYILLGILISAGIIQMVLAILVPQRGPYSRTVRMVCYAQSTALLAIVPFFGGIIGGIWSLVITTKGVREVHRTTTGRATATVLLPGGCLMLFIVVLGVIAALVMGSGFLSKLPQ